MDGIMLAAALLTGASLLVGIISLLSRDNCLSEPPGLAEYRRAKQKAGYNPNKFDHSL